MALTGICRWCREPITWDSIARCWRADRNGRYRCLGSTVWHTPQDHNRTNPAPAA